MKVDVENISPVKKVLHVEVPEAEVTSQLDKAYRTLRGTVKLKGFRPGKIPRSILEQRFRKEVHAEVSGELIQSSYGEAVRESELQPVMEPKIDKGELELGQPYRYTATVEVRPSISDLKLTGLKLKRQAHAVVEEEVEAQLKLLQKRSAELKTIDEKRSARSGDFALIDYEGLLDGKPFEPARKTENFMVEIGSGRMLKAFEENLIGMAPDTTKAFKVPFPDDYYNKELAGREVEFRVTLKEIKAEVLPEIDDEFAKDLGEYETLDGLKDAIRKSLEQRYEAQSKRQLRKDIMELLIGQCDFEVPEGLVEQELAQMIEESRRTMTLKGMRAEGPEFEDEALREKFSPLAERKVREYLLLQKAIEQEGIELTDEILNSAYEEFAGALNQPADVIKKYHESDKDAYDLFRERTLEKHAIKWIVDHSDVETEEIGNEEFDKTEEGER